MDISSSGESPFAVAARTCETSTSYNIETNKYYIHNELWLHNTVQGGGENWTAMQPQTSIATPQCDGEPAEEVSGGGGGPDLSAMA